jgi:hypothetical protein
MIKEKQKSEIQPAQFIAKVISFSTQFVQKNSFYLINEKK